MASLAIGYGSGGSVPYTYYLRDGQDVDVGFLKLFLATQPLNLSDVRQASPFDPVHRGVDLVPAKTRLAWDALCVTVVQRRRPPVIRRTRLDLLYFLVTELLSSLRSWLL